MSKEYEYWLHSLPEIGDATIGRLLERYGNEENIYNACLSEEEDFIQILKKIRLRDDKISNVIKRGKSIDPVSNYQKIISEGIGFVTVHDKEYPSRLRSISNMPYALYYLGELPKDNIPSVAIIGARNCSEYGRYVAGSFGERLALAGINVISGMALGIDGIGQRGALEAGGTTYAVLGSGVDICYPRENLDLYRRIPQKGGVISCFPPGSEPQRRFFPERNKIVAGLSDAVLVIEARQKSGTGITVNLALSMNKDVYAVPGRITDRLSDGCNMLISQGAGAAISPDNFVSEIQMLWNRKKGMGEETACSGNGEENENNDAYETSIIHETAETRETTDKKLKKNLITYDQNQRFKNGKPNIDRPYVKLDVPDPDSFFLKYVDVKPQSIQQIHSQRLKDDPGADISDTISKLALLCIDGRIVQIGSGYYYKSYSG